MKNLNISILGFDLIRENVPANVQEINESAKDDEAAYNLAIAQWQFHSDYSRLRPAICEAVEKATGVSRLSHEEEGARGMRTIYDESENNFLKRIGEMLEDGELPEEVTETSLRETAQAAVNAVPVSLEKAVRGTGGGMPAKKWLAWYDQAVEEDVVDEKIANINNSDKYTGADLSAEDEDIRVKFALAVKEIITKKEKELSLV